jgi:hypothetical protein
MASNAPDDEIRAIVAHLARSLPLQRRRRGDAANGQRISWRAPAASGWTGRAARLALISRASAPVVRVISLAREIRDASAAITPGYQPVTIGTKEASVRGARKNEDVLHSDHGHRSGSGLRADLRGDQCKTSLMPTSRPIA